VQFTCVPVNAAAYSSQCMHSNSLAWAGALVTCSIQVQAIRTLCASLLTAASKPRHGNQQHLALDVLTLLSVFLLLPQPRHAG
jgi:hypothetical protein